MENEYFSDDFFESNSDDIFKEESVEIKEDKKVSMSILDNYSDELTAKTYVTNPAISREEQLKSMILILLSPVLYQMYLRIIEFIKLILLLYLVIMNMMEL